MGCHACRGQDCLPAFSLPRLTMNLYINASQITITNKVNGITTAQYTQISSPSLKVNMFVVKRVAIYAPGRNKIVKTEIALIAYKSFSLASLARCPIRLYN
jgi:hypothetical protein